MQAGLDFVRRNSKKAWRKTSDNRLEYPEYPERAVEEGLVNALIHRNYLELGSEVHIDMYDDRLEIFSPGGLLDGGSIKDMDVMNMASRRRNPVLAWRKRSMSTHSERFNPPTFEPENGLKTA